MINHPKGNTHLSTLRDPTAHDLRCELVGVTVTITLDELCIRSVVFYFLCILCVGGLGFVDEGGER